MGSVLSLASRAAALAALLALAAACATPSQTFASKAKKAGLVAGEIKGDAFEHALYWNEAALEMRARGQGPVLHVYLGGDGVPWKAGHPTTDPTPRNPLMLRLITYEHVPAVYLGRPCFHGLAKSEHCDWSYWNDARYSEPVVTSMTAALTKLREETGAQKVILFGASGGGALAVLMADRVEFVRGIVTVAANLDTRAWLSYHEYDGMKESLNPAIDGRRRETDHSNVFERHYAGGRDIVVPPDTVTAGLRRPSELVVIPDYDHNCCWTEIWPQVLADVARAEGEVPSASSGE